MDRGSFLSSSDLVQFTTNPSSSRTIINLTPRQKSARCIKRSDIFHLSTLFKRAYTHIFLSSLIHRTCTVDFTGVSNALIKCAARTHCPLCLLVNYDRRQTNRRPSFYPFAECHFLASPRVQRQRSIGRD